MLITLPLQSPKYILFLFVIVTSPHSGTCDTQVAPTMCSCSHVTPYFERFNDQHLDSWNGTPVAIDTCKTRWGEWMENRRSTYKMAIASLSNVQTWLVFSLNSSALISFDSNACLSSRHRGACISYSVTPGGHKSKIKKIKNKKSLDDCFPSADGNAKLERDWPLNRVWPGSIKSAMASKDLHSSTFLSSSFLSLCVQWMKN